MALLLRRALHLSRARWRLPPPTITTTTTAAATPSAASTVRRAAAAAFSSSSSSSSSSAAAPAAAGMQDEYGVMDDSGQTFVFNGDFQLEAGGVLHRPQVKYRTWGELNEAKDNCLVVCHALTGNQSLDSWWGECLGPGKSFDTDKYFVVCANVLGSCYGTTGPSSAIQGSPSPASPSSASSSSPSLTYGDEFPTVSIRDTVNLHIAMVSEGLGVSSVESVVGGSMGGMQVLEWLFLGGPGFVRSAVPIACGAQHSAWQIAISETQRQAIRLHPDPSVGLGVARMIAMVSYRTKGAYDVKFGRDAIPPARRAGGEAEEEKPWGPFQVRSYLEHQGRKFNQRFDPASYVAITEQMDSHDVGRGRGGIEAALGSLDTDQQPTLVMGIDSDVLYPLTQQEELHRLLKGSEFSVINSDHGHDGFLLEVDQISKATTDFLARVRAKKLSEQAK